MSTIKSITMLGTGTSTGIPMVGCHCSVCSSSDKFDKRLRSSIMITTSEDKKILIDTSPDLRQQCFSHKIEALDAVIITHEHADHTHGIDELRPLTYIRSAQSLGPLPVLTWPQCAKNLVGKFPYIFNPGHHQGKKILGGGIPLLELLEVELDHMSWSKKIKVAGLSFEFFLCPHGHGHSMSFCTDQFVYIVDCHEIPEETVDKLKQKNLKLMLIDCLQRIPQQTHLTMNQSFNYIKKIAPKCAGLFHMNHDLSHHFLTEQIKINFEKNGPDVFVSYDNQVINL